jgi:endoglucanase
MGMAWGLIGRLLSVIALLSCLSGCRAGGTAVAPATVPITVPFARGVNLGNALEAPSEGEWGVVLQADYFDRIAAAGFDTVRIPIRWSTHAQGLPPYTIDADFMARVDWAVDQALSHGLTTIIDMHHYEEIMAAPEAHRSRFLALWRQIATHYAGAPDNLFFELLNEPNNQLTPGLWNNYLAAALDVVRESNPERTVIVGTAEWGGLGALDELELPDDPHLVVTLHYYEPFHFTHQGAEWSPGSDEWLGTTWEGTAAEQRAVTRDLDSAARWAERQGIPLFLGEFGAYSRADMASRARWTAFVSREAERRGMAWTYWEFCSGFGVYDPAAGAWREPLLEALLPATTAG